MEFVILTGLSGAGKTNALHAMEDSGFYCVDNLPPLLLDTFFDLCINSTDIRLKKVAVVADARSGEMFADIPEVLSKLRLEGKQFKILFLDAKPDVLLVRYKGTRRKHPLIGEITSGSLEDAVALENELMNGVREMADYVVDTTVMNPNELKERVTTLFSAGAGDSLIVTCMSFGYKYGIPPEADLVFDVRCLPNPFYIKELKTLSGLDEQVCDYILGFEVSERFMQKLYEFIDYTLPLYREEGKSELVIGVGCTGGRHRSVTVARLLNTHFIENGQKSAIHHRDIWKA
ncbi:MAG: RNase adapter RapZ [Ruminococcus sp.]|uniref:RNase adapter RapZ n=1 Tax=Ruminococcus sp. TaxID=41978 RepID=UPI0028737959|nr:RNase adapter RapZ [Ruminococcus sp.]MBQ3286185.1 RNase adapter RapZ [Ruminococcus sp.]